MGLLCVSLFQPQVALAQTVPCPPAGIKTDPAVAVNPGGQPNTFNWYYGNYQPSVYNGKMYKLNSPYPGVGQDYIEMPWLQPTNPVMDRFQGLIDKPSDGWELIRRDLGYDDAGNPVKTTNPTLILYNRFTSMLRVFTAVGDLQNGYQFAEIKLKFGTAATNKAGTLNRQSALGVALEDTEPHTNPEFAAVARYLNGRSKWFVADFPMEYDPCVCQFDSRLQINVNLISQADVKLVGQTTGSLVSAANGTSTAGADFDKGIPFIRKVNNALSAGGKSYDSIDKLTTALTGKKGADSGALGALNTAAKKSDFLKAGLANLPWIGGAVALLDFFMGGGKEAGPQPVVMQPMTIEMSTTTTGTITTNNWATGVPFNNPGNRLSGSIPENVPYYNEAMGVFSLLKRPTVDVRTTPNYVTGSMGSSLTRYSFRLTDDLQYVINPAARLAVQDFQAALVFEGPNEAIPTRPYYDYGGIQTYEGVTTDATGMLQYAYRTEYADALSIKNSIYSYISQAYTNSTPTTDFKHTNVYVKVILNLRPLDCSTCQNVLFVARYPVTVNNVSSYATLPAASAGVLPQASATAIQAVCQGTKYKQAIVLLRPGKVAATGAATAPGLPAGLALRAIPNPAAGSVRLSYRMAQPGRVRLTLNDALGREVRTILDREQPADGTFEATANLAGLRAGIYYCTLRTDSQQVVEKIVVTD